MTFLPQCYNLQKSYLGALDKISTRVPIVPLLRDVRLFLTFEATVDYFEACYHSIGILQYVRNRRKVLIKEARAITVPLTVDIDANLRRLSYLPAWMHESKAVRYKGRDWTDKDDMSDTRVSTNITKGGHL